MFQRIRAALPAYLLAGAALSVCVPSTGAHAATTAPVQAVYVSQRVIEIVVADGSVTDLDLDHPSAGEWAGDFGTDVILAPDGRTAYVAFEDSSRHRLGVFTIDAASGTYSHDVFSPVAGAGSPHIMLSPDSRTLSMYVGPDIYVVDIASGSVTRHITVTSDVNTLAQAPDGSVLYATSGDRLLKVSPTTGAVVDSLDLGQRVGAVKLSADGATAFVAGNADSTHDGHLFKVALASMHVTASTSLPGAGLAHPTAHAVALSPDQSLLYVVVSDDVNAREEALPFKASDLSPLGAPVVFFTGDVWIDRGDAAFSADGATLFVYHDGRQSGGTAAIDVASQTVTNLSSGTTGWVGVATPPHPAPTARLAVAAHCAGQATAFDASASTATGASIVSYAWTFGDGTTATTTGPKTTHVYAKAGSYAATVRVTDSLGASTSVVYDGQNVVYTGGPGARRALTVRVGACPVEGEHSQSHPQGGAGQPGRPTGSGGSGASDTAASAQQSTADGSLAFTGSDTRPALFTATGFIAAGVGLILAGRRRRSRWVLPPQ